MRRCIELARRAEGRTEPNPMVGALIVRDGQIVAEGWHQGPGQAHAEVDALRRLEGSAAGATVIVNLEPCCHFGRTPPCTDALIDSRVERVVVGMVDPNPQVSGKGIRHLRDAGIEVVVGVEEARCLQLNREFVDRVQRSVDSGTLDPAGFVPGSFAAAADGPTRFVILSAPRTGSNYLCSLLDSHPQILCHHELFNLDGIRYALSRRSDDFSLGSLAERDRDPVGFVHRVWRRPEGARAVGFKLARRHPEFVFRDVIADPGVRKLLLRRRNRLKTHVSELVAQEELQWTHYGRHPDELPRLQVTVDLDDFRAFALEYDAFYDRITRALVAGGEPWLELDYERLFLPETLAQILAYLGFLAADLVGLRGATPKRNSDDLDQVIRNYDEVARALAGTPYEADLHERAPWRAAAPRRLRLELFVHDLAESRDFYTRGLGLELLRHDDSGYTVLRSRDVTLALQQLDALEPDHYLRRGPAHENGLGVEIVLEVECLDHCFAKLASAGWPVLAAPQVRPWGDRDFRIADPNGYYIRLTERPSTSAGRDS